MSSEYVLSVDSSSSVGWVTLAQIVDGLRVHVLSELSIKAFSHAEALLPAIHAVLQEHSVSASALRFLLFGDGPGSFTGLRIGASILSGLAYSTSGAMIGVASHAGIACAYARALFAKQSVVASTPLYIRVFSEGGDTLVSSTFKIVGELTGLSRCEPLELMEPVASEGVVELSDTIMLGTEGIWKGRVPIPGVTLVEPDILPISTGLVLGFYAIGESIRLGTMNVISPQVGNGSFVRNFINGIVIRYGQPVKAQTLVDRRGW